MLSSQTKSAKPCYGVVCNDAGSANVIFAWIKEETGTNHVYASGPALAILNSDPKLRLKCMLTDSIESLVKSVDVIVTGTGWQTHTEVSGIYLARQLRKPCIAVIDHWTNYRERFYLDGRSVLPDEIWVTDKWAYDIAKKEFPSLEIKLQRNAYTEQMICKIQSFAVIPNRLLYIGEPIRDVADSVENPELEAYQYFCERAPFFGLNLKKLEIHLRPHPSQPINFYDEWKSRFPEVKIIEHDGPLDRAIGQAAIVVGLCSYALFLSVQAKKKTISAVPEWAPPCPIPHEKIISI